MMPLLDSALYERILIIGPGHHKKEVERLKEIYSHSTKNLILESNETLFEQLAALKEKVAGDAIIDVVMHGTIVSGEHYIQSTDKGVIPTKSLLERIADIFPQRAHHPLLGGPLIQLRSCYAGAALKHSIPEGMTVMAHSSSDRESLTGMMIESIDQSIQRASRNIMEEYTASALSSPETLVIASRGKDHQEKDTSFRMTQRMPTRYITHTGLRYFFSKQLFSSLKEKIASLKLPSLSTQVENQQQQLERYSEQDTLEYMKKSCFIQLAKKRPNIGYIQHFFRHTKTRPDEVTLADGNSLLNYACQKNQPRIISFLCQQGANPNALGKKEGSPLITAAKYHSVKAVKCLIEQGADVNQLNASKTFSPLRVAVEKNDQAIAQHLLEKGAKIDDGVTKLPLLIGAVENNQNAMVRLLLKHGANIEEKILLSKGDKPIELTPLALAVKHQKIGMVRLLLDRGADANVRMKGEMNLLMFAMLDPNSNKEIVQCLLRYGATLPQRYIDHKFLERSDIKPEVKAVYHQHQEALFSSRWVEKVKQTVAEVAEMTRAVFL